MKALGLAQGDLVTLSTDAKDHARKLGGLQVFPYDIPRNMIAGYYPECNVLIPLDHFAEGSKVPAAKSIPVRITRDPSFDQDAPRRQDRASVD
jgi:hypothetical protein